MKDDHRSQIAKIRVEQMLRLHFSLEEIAEDFVQADTGLIASILKGSSEFVIDEKMLENFEQAVRKAQAKFCFNQMKSLGFDNKEIAFYAKVSVGIVSKISHNKYNVSPSLSEAFIQAVYDSIKDLTCRKNIRFFDPCHEYGLSITQDMEAGIIDSTLLRLLSVVTQKENNTIWPLGFKAVLLYCGKGVYLIAINPNLELEEFDTLNLLIHEIKHILSRLEHSRDSILLKNQQIIPPTKTLHRQAKQSLQPERPIPPQRSSKPAKQNVKPIPPSNKSSQTKR